MFTPLCALLPAGDLAQNGCAATMDGTLGNGGKQDACRGAGGALKATGVTAPRLS
jgi:hypothetical protein